MATTKGIIGRRMRLLNAAKRLTAIGKKDKARQRKGLLPITSDPDAAVRKEYYDAIAEWHNAIEVAGVDFIAKAVEHYLKSNGELEIK